VSFQELLTEGELVVHVEMREAARGRVESEIILDPGIALPGLHQEVFEIQLGKQPREPNRRLTRDEHVDVRAASEREPEMLIALPVAIGDRFVGKPPEQGVEELEPPPRRGLLRFPRRE
jgi:hypothetical protein